MNQPGPTVIRQTFVEWLRWFGVLPAALAGDHAVQVLTGVLLRIAEIVPGNLDRVIPAFALELLFHVIPEAGFVVAGAMLAPQGRVTTAVALTLVRCLLSALVHLVAQPHPGMTNFTHFALEMMGSALGVACMILLGRRSPS